MLEDESVRGHLIADLRVMFARRMRHTTKAGVSDVCYIEWRAAGLDHFQIAVLIQIKRMPVHDVRRLVDRHRACRRAVCAGFGHGGLLRDHAAAVVGLRLDFRHGRGAVGFRHGRCHGLRRDAVSIGDGRLSSYWSRCRPEQQS